MKPASTPMRHFLTLVQTVLACAPAQIARLTRGLLACMLLTLLGAAQAASVTGTITMVKEDGAWKASDLTLNLK